MSFLKHSFFVFTIWYCFCLPCVGKEISQTLQSPTNDVVTITYSIMEKDGRVTIIFNNIKKVLSLGLKEKYDDFECLKVVFFERVGTYKEDKFRSDIEITSIMVPSDDIKYNWSEEGYVIIGNGTRMPIDMLANKATLSIPIYLVYYLKPHTYKVLSKCGNLDIYLSKNIIQPQDGGTTTQIIRREVPVTEEIEVEEDMSPEQESQLLIDRIEECLNKRDKPLSDVDIYVNKLRELEYTLQDAGIKHRAQEVLQQYEETKRVVALQDQEKKDNDTKQKEEDNARLQIAYIKERLEKIKDLDDIDLAGLKTSSNELRKKSFEIKDNELSRQMKDTADECDSAIKEIEDGKKRRNIWLIIGGILLLILISVGNHFLKSARNKRQIEDMEKSQKKMMKQAEYDAKRQAQQMVRDKTNQVQTQIRQKSSKIAQDVRNNGNSNRQMYKNNNDSITI